MDTSYVLIIITLLNLILIYWGDLRFFRDPGDVDRKKVTILRYATALTGLSCLLSILVFPSNNVPSLAGIAFALVSSFLQVAAFRAAGKSALTPAYSRDLPEAFVSDGPFKWVRHPFYTSYLLCYFGASLGSRHFLPYACTLIMLVFYIRAAKIEEEKFSKSSLAGAYAHYRSKTGMFLPKFPAIFS